MTSPGSTVVALIFPRRPPTESTVSTPARKPKAELEVVNTSNTREASATSQIMSMTTELTFAVSVVWLASTWASWSLIQISTTYWLPWTTWVIEEGSAVTSSTSGETSIFFPDRILLPRPVISTCTARSPSYNWSRIALVNGVESSLAQTPLMVPAEKSTIGLSSLLVLW